MHTGGIDLWLGECACRSRDRIDDERAGVLGQLRGLVGFGRPADRWLSRLKTGNSGLLALPFHRGGNAERSAIRNLQTQASSRRFWNSEPAVDRAVLAGVDVRTRGAVAVRFTGRNAQRRSIIQVVVGNELWSFRTSTTDFVILPPGVYPVRVRQSRVGANAGACRVEYGQVTELEYRVNFWGPPGGKFIRKSAQFRPMADFGSGSAGGLAG